MKIKDNWRVILRKAWSVKFMVLAALFDGLASVWFVMSDAVPTPAFMAIGVGLNLAGVLARIVKQDGI